MIERFQKVRSELSVPDHADIWDLTSDEAGEAFTALSSQTAREVLALLYEEPHTASELADDLDQSLQNIRYHLQNLIDAELVQVGDIEYSQKGKEMKLYVPTTNAVVLLAGESTVSRIRNLLGTLVRGIAIIGIGAIVFRQIVVERLVAVPGIDVEIGLAGADIATVYNVSNPDWSEVGLEFNGIYSASGLRSPGGSASIQLIYWADVPGDSWDTITESWTGTSYTYSATGDSTDWGQLPNGGDGNGQFGFQISTSVEVIGPEGGYASVDPVIHPTYRAFELDVIVLEDWLDQW